MRITFSESKDDLVISGKGLITYLGLKAKARSNKCKNARYSIKNASKKYLSKIIREFENYLTKVMIIRGPNMSLLTVTFNY